MTKMTEEEMRKERREDFLWAGYWMLAGIFGATFMLAYDSIFMLVYFAFCCYRISDRWSSAMTWDFALRNDAKFWFGEKGDK